MKKIKTIKAARFLVLSDEILYTMDHGEKISVDEIIYLAKKRTLVSWIGVQYNMIDGWSTEEIEIMNDAFSECVTYNISDRFGIVNNGWHLLLKCCNLCITNILYSKD